MNRDITLNNYVIIMIIDIIVILYHLMKVVIQMFCQCEDEHNVYKGSNKKEPI